MSYLRNVCLLGIVVANTYWLHEQHVGYFIRGRHYLPFAGAWVHLRVLVRSVMVIVLVFCVVFLFCLSSSCILCTLCCQFLWIVHSWLSLRFSLTFIYSISVWEAITVWYCSCMFCSLFDIKCILMLFYTRVYSKTCILFCESIGTVFIRIPSH